jgi:hypothetical protein
MRRAFHGAAIVTLFWCLASCALAQSSRPDERQRDKTAAAERQDQSAERLTVIADELRALREQLAGTDQSAGEDVYWPPIWSNWVLAILAGVAAVIAGLSLRAIREQVAANVTAAKAARDSADAAGHAVQKAQTNLTIMEHQLAQMGAQTAATQMAAEAARRSANIAATTLAISERAYLDIGDWQFGGFGQEHTIFSYRFTVTGRTPATIIGGTIRLSIDEPVAVQPHIDNRFEQPVRPQTVGPMMRPHQFVIFPNVPAEVAAAWKAGGIGRTMYIGGTIRYRDAFPNTPVHRKHFSVFCLGPDAMFATNNPGWIVMNYEDDEPIESDQEDKAGP